MLKNNMKKDQTITTAGKVISLNEKGEGILASKKGELFVAGSFPGDYVEVVTGSSRRKKYKKKAFLKKIISSEYPRITPFCKHFSLCGGCNRQDISYDNQLKIKSQLVHDLLSPLVQSTQPNHPQLNAPLSIVACEQPTFYRNRMDYFMGSHKWLEIDPNDSKEINKEKEEREKIDMRGTGLHVKGLHDRVIHIEKCYLQNSNAIRNTVHDWAIANQVAYYNSRNQSGWLKGLIVRTTLLEQTMVIIEALEESLDSSKDSLSLTNLIQHLTAQHPEITSIYTVINQEKKENILDLPHQHVYGAKFIEEKCGNLKFNIYPEVFYQTNSTQTVKLYDWVVQSMNIDQTTKTVLDLYCGIGSISLYLAAAHPHIKVTGVDIVSHSIQAAKENATLNKITNANFYTGAIQDLTDEDMLKASYDWIILDPPRAGLHPKVIDYLNRLKPKPKLIYISCNPFTLAKDLKILTRYQIEHWQPVDMFPHTHHIETVTKLIPKV